MPSSDELAEKLSERLIRKTIECVALDVNKTAYNGRAEDLEILIRDRDFDRDDDRLALRFFSSAKKSDKLRLSEETIPAREALLTWFQELGFAASSRDEWVLYSGQMIDIVFEEPLAQLSQKIDAALSFGVSSKEFDSVKKKPARRI